MAKKPKLDYRLARGDTIAEIEADVERWISLGYRPYGNIAFGPAGRGKLLYLQPMVSGYSRYLRGADC